MMQLRYISSEKDLSISKLEPLPAAGPSLILPPSKLLRSPVLETQNKL